MTNPENREIAILLARIDERLSNVQEDISEINGARHCEAHTSRLEQFEKDLSHMNLKWWAALLAIIGAWIKAFFFSATP